MLESAQKQLDAMVATIEPRIIDQNAFFISELCEASGYKESQMQRIIKENVKAGKWEKVFKRKGSNVYAAYRIKLKKAT